MVGVLHCPPLSSLPTVPVWSAVCSTERSEERLSPSDSQDSWQSECTTSYEPYDRQQIMRPSTDKRLRALRERRGDEPLCRWAGSPAEETCLHAGLREKLYLCWIFVLEISRVLCWRYGTFPLHLCWRYQRFPLCSWGTMLSGGGSGQCRGFTLEATQGQMDVFFSQLP